VLHVETVGAFGPLSLRNWAEKTCYCPHDRATLVTVAFQDFRNTPEADIGFRRGIGRKGPIRVILQCRNTARPSLSARHEITSQTCRLRRDIVLKLHWA
jgi:hypothetical protein